MKTNNLALAVVALVLLGGCASGVVREPAAGAAVAERAVQPVKLSAITVSLSPEAQKLLGDNLKFNQEILLATVRRGLEAKGLLGKEGSATAEIVVRDIRVRSSFSAVMFGIMAGTDTLSGDVIVNEPGGKGVRKFNVSASYGLGGIAGGQDDVRMNWLYEKFAEHTIAELSGGRKE